MANNSISSTQASTVATAAAVESLFTEHHIFRDGEQEESNDFSYWEFINPSDADDSDTGSLHSLENGFVLWRTLTSNLDSNTSTPDISPENETLAQDTHLGYYDDDYDVNGVNHDDGDGDGDDEDEDDCVYGYGLDDELVPWNLSGKLGRQRMRKLGKRGFSRMGSSKKNPYLYVKPGCVRGKHGLGIKA